MYFFTVVVLMNTKFAHFDYVSDSIQVDDGYIREPFHMAVIKELPQLEFRLTAFLGLVARMYISIFK